MVMSSCSLMGSSIVFFPDSSPTLQTILKSEWSLPIYFFLLTFSNRVLLCCVRYLRNWPCPCCLVRESEIQELGTKQDINWQETRRHIDDDRRCMLVETAWEMIYQDGVWPGAKAISRLLESQALNPMCVSSISWKSHSIFPYRMHSLNGSQNMGLTFIQCSLLICSTNLNWGSGRLFSPTFYGSYMLREAMVSKNSMKGKGNLDYNLLECLQLEHY